MDQKQTINIDLRECETIRCDANVGSEEEPRECGCMIWTQAFILKKISALTSPTGKEEEYPMPVMMCPACGKVRLPGAPKKEEKSFLAKV